LEAGFFHLEDTDLVGRAESILNGSQNTKAVTALALKIKDSIDHVFEHPRTGDSPVFRYVANQKRRQPGFFARTMMEPELSRTCAILPGADGRVEVKIV
jgi:hypothetical protein